MAAEPVKSNNTVTVCCKLPNGIHMDLPGRGRVTLRGTAVPYGVPPIIVPGGYAMTPDVDEEFAAEWFRQNAKLTIVEQNIVFMMVKPPDARAKAKELTEVKTGLEPINPEKPGKGIEPIGARYT